MRPRTPIHGIMAEFATPHAILAATRQAHVIGYRAMDAYTPFPVEGLAEELGLARTRVPFVVLLCALVGAAAGFGMQYWTMAVDYPFNSGGRPLNSWPAFVPVTFEVMVLVSGIGAVLGMLLLNGLPQPYHPVFSVPRFVEASQYRFFLCIEATDPRFDRRETRLFLESLQPLQVLEVPHYEDALKRDEVIGLEGDGRGREPV